MLLHVVGSILGVTSDLSQSGSKTINKEDSEANSYDTEANADDLIRFYDEYRMYLNDVGMISGRYWDVFGMLLGCCCDVCGIVWKLPWVWSQGRLEKRLK